MEEDLKRLEDYIDKIIEKEEVSERLEANEEKAAASASASAASASAAAAASASPYDPGLEIREDFKSNIKSWLKYEKEIKDQMKILKELRNKKKEVEERLKSYMCSNEIAVVKVSNVKIQRSSTKKQPPLNKENLKKCISEFTGRQDEAERIVEHVYNWRKENPIGSVESLKKLNG